MSVNQRQAPVPVQVPIPGPVLTHDVLETASTQMIEAEIARLRGVNASFEQGSMMLA